MSLVSKSGVYPKYFVSANEVLDTLRNYMLVDGFDFILDLHNSNDSKLKDLRYAKEFTDFFTFFASVPIGLNHPKISNINFIDYLGRVALTKPSNSDIYTEEYATFVNTFFKVAVPKEFKYSFFIDGGALAVENALKTAFDWKVRKNLAKGKGQLGSKIIHFKQAFHGRSGYTMSLTNTDPNKVMYYPKFEWPRISNPKLTFPLTDDSLTKVIELEKQSITEIKDAFVKYPDDIAAIIIEPIQGEGGDNHFRPEFLQSLRTLADENEALLIFDEVQTGGGLTGSFFAFEQMNVTPDIAVFGKKMQVCGIISTNRVDEVPDNVFHTSSRINSTWGGNLVDMVRSTRYLEIIQDENLLANVKLQGKVLYSEMRNLQGEFPEIINNIRHRGLFAAFDFVKPELRPKFLEKTMQNGLIILPCGEKSIRFRPALDVKADTILNGFEIIKHSLKEILA
ncbi:MAG: L-lysine 6-transaminase [Candidatus Kapaibacteriota bacterium]